MKKARKLLVALLVLTFLLGTFNVGFVAAAEEDLPSHVVRAIALGYLKGFEDGDLKLDQPITRAQALAFIIRISGLDSSAELMKGQTQFADVNNDPSLQWATGYINLGVGQGIVNGYPDGTFKGNNNVTYAEMAKMILYAMNYGVTVEGGQWPAAVMGKADDLDIFDKVNALPNLPALRGDVVKMIDNSLTVSHLKQTGHGDIRFYEEDPDTTFLSKMKVEELEDVRVTEIARVNNKLDDDEIRLVKIGKDDKEEINKVYSLIADVAPEEIFGLEIDAWVNDDDEVFFVNVKTAEKDILLDTVKDASDDDIKLLDADKTYKWADDAIAYVNFEEVDFEVDFEEIADNAYGKVVLDRGEVAFANLFEFDNVGVVTEVDGKVIEFVDDDTNEEDIDLDDYDDVYVYNADFSKADVEDIDVDSAIFFWEGEDDDIYIIVKNEVVEGEVDRVREDKVRVDGTEYKKGSYAIITLDDGDSYEAWTRDAVEDFMDEEVKVILDLRGQVLLITGESTATSGDLYGIVTYVENDRAYEILTIFNEEGKEVDYRAESKNEFNDLLYLEFDPDGDDTPEYAVIRYKLNADGEIAENKSAYLVINGDEPSEEDEDIEDEGIYVGDLNKQADKKYFRLNGDRFYITDDTIIVKALNNKGELKPELIKNDRLIELTVTDNNKAVVFGEVNKDAKFIVFLDKEFAGSDEDFLFGVVIDDPWKEGKDYYAEINVFGEGIAVYKVNDRDDFLKGKVVAFDINSKDEAVFDDDKITTDELYTYDDGYITVGEDTYKVDRNAVLYSLKDDGKLDKKISMSKLDDYDKITFVLDDQVVVAAVVWNEEEE